MKNLVKTLLGLFLTICVLSVRAHTTDPDKACQQFSTDAQNAIKNNKIIYMRFGMPVYLLSKETLSYLKEKYNVEVQQRGCLIQAGEHCYNKEVDAYLMKKHGKTALQLIAEAETKTGSKK